MPRPRSCRSRPASRTRTAWSTSHTGRRHEDGFYGVGSRGVIRSRRTAARGRLLASTRLGSRLAHELARARVMGSTADTPAPAPVGVAGGARGLVKKLVWAGVTAVRQF